MILIAVFINALDCLGCAPKPDNDAICEDVLYKSSVGLVGWVWPSLKPDEIKPLLGLLHCGKFDDTKA